jgi:predicted transcriptional regulator
LRRHRFEVIADHFQTLLLHLDKLRRRVDDVIRTIMRRMSENRCVNNSKFDNRFVYQSCFDKTRLSDEDDETRQRQRLNDHLFLNVLDVNFSFELDVNLHLQNANLIKRLLYDVAYSNDCLHVKFSRVSRQINELIFDRREDDFVTTRLRLAMSVHFFQNATVACDAKLVRQYVDIIHEAQRRNSTRRTF